MNPDHSESVSSPGSSHASPHVASIPLGDSPEFQGPGNPQHNSIKQSKTKLSHLIIYLKLYVDFSSHMDFLKYTDVSIKFLTQDSYLKLSSQFPRDKKCCDCLEASFKGKLRRTPPSWGRNRQVPGQRQKPGNYQKLA